MKFNVYAKQTTYYIAEIDADNIAEIDADNIDFDEYKELAEIDFDIIEIKGV